MPKIKMVCPYCGSDDVTRDALARWSVEGAPQAHARRRFAMN